MRDVMGYPWCGQAWLRYSGMSVFGTNRWCAGRERTKPVVSALCEEGGHQDTAQNAHAEGLFVLGCGRLIGVIARTRFFLGFGYRLLVFFGFEKLLDNGSHRHVPWLGIGREARLAFGVDLDPGWQPGLRPADLPACGEPPPYPGHTVRYIPVYPAAPAFPDAEHGEDLDHDADQASLPHSATHGPRTRP